MDRKEQIKQAGIRRHGSEEAWRKFLSDSAKLSKGGGLAYLKIHDPEKLREIASKGGKSRAGKTKKVVEETSE